MSIHSTSLSDMQQIDDVCTAFEDAILNNQSPQLEEYLSKLPHQKDALLAELLRIKAAYLVAESDELNAIRQAYPQLTRLIDEEVGRKSTAPVEAKRAGQFEIVRRIGSGAFGVVYEGLDPELNRKVAIKVCHKKWLGDDDRISKAIQEARIQAKFNHPNIARVFAAGKSEEFGFYIVTDLIDGPTLADAMREEQMPQQVAIDLVRRLASALKHAHTHGVVHRDVTPQNIMIDASGNPYLLDFGLALSAVNWGDGPQYVGTPRYMSPEQRRGESHRVDKTSDIYSLGIVLEELLRCKTGDTSNDAAGDADLPPMLQRILDRATADRASDHYQTVEEFENDLSQVSTQEESTKDHPVFVPRGLRPFEASDASFFMKLLPGPYNADGVPIHLTKLSEQVDNKSSVAPSPVAFLLGSSGSGKSSLIKAGLLPLLPRRIASILVDAELPNLVRQIEVSIGEALETATACELPELVAGIRDGELLGPDRKVLVVIDHFEAWLSAQEDLASSMLLNALRQSDGRRCQFLLIVRSEEYQLVQRLMRELDIRMTDGVNSFSPSSFDREHTQSVLRSYASHYGRDSSPEQEKLIERISEVLSLDAESIPLRIALIAEAMKTQLWTEEAFDSLGGIDGIISKCVRKRIDSVDPLSAAGRTPLVMRNILQALLPSDSKENLPVLPLSTLREKCATKIQEAEIADLLLELDSGLRLVTPVGQTQDSEQSYRLTHRFLVDPIRKWVRESKLKSLSGRAAFCLAERTKTWDGIGHKSLPKTTEYLYFSLLTDRKTWDSKTKSMMGAARTKLRKRWLIAIGAMLILLPCAAMVGTHLSAENQKQKQLEREALFASFVNASHSAASGQIEKLLAQTTPEQREELIQNFSFDSENALQGLRLKVLEAYDGEVDAAWLIECIVNLSERRYGPRADKLYTDEYSVILSALRKLDNEELKDALEKAIAITVKDGQKIPRPAASKRIARIALTAIYLGVPAIAEELCASKSIRGETFVHEQKLQLIFQSQFLSDAQETILNTLQETENESLAFHLMSMLAVHRSGNMSASTRKQIEHVLLDRLANAPSYALRTVASCVLSRWNVSHDASLVYEAEDCERNEIGMAMVKCRSLSDRTIKLEGEDAFLWVSNTEVTESQFAQFAKSKSHGPVPNGITESTRLLDAIRFCNWLSIKHGLQPCYELPENTEDISQVIITNRNSGYRLPMLYEWTMSCSPAVRPPELQKLRSHAAHNSAGFVATDRRSQVGRHLPNENGLYDAYGSVWEWAINSSHTWNAGVAAKVAVYGGCQKSPSPELGEPYFFLDTTAEKSIPESLKATLSENIHRFTERTPKGIGFRVVRNGEPLD